MSLSLPMPVRAVFQRKPIWFALVAGVGAYAALTYFPNPLAASTRGLLAWDIAIVVDLSALLILLHNATPQEMTRRAALTDEGRFFVLWVSLLAVLVSIVAIVLEAGVAAGTHGAAKGLHVAFVLATVALSWLFVHASFANHYAHEYYGPADESCAPRGGLAFPGTQDPEFWDFLHFALVIGVANQTADVDITGKPIRNIVSLHGVAAFVFNTVILALAINFAASMI